MPVEEPERAITMLSKREHENIIEALIVAVNHSRRYERQIMRYTSDSAQVTQWDQLRERLERER